MRKLKSIPNAKKAKRDTKILLLCHGNKHSFTEGCPFPISRKMMSHVVTLDVRESTEPDIVEDFTKKTQLSNNSMDLVCGIFYPCNLLVTSGGKLRKNHFLSNISKVLKIGGYYVLTNLPLFGKHVFCKFLQSSDGQKFLWSLGLTRSSMREISDIIKKFYSLDIENIDENGQRVISETQDQLNSLFCLYIEQNNKNLKLINSTKEHNLFKTTFLDKFVENNKLDTLDIGYFNRRHISANIFVKT